MQTCDTGTALVTMWPQGACAWLLYIHQLALPAEVCFGNLTGLSLSSLLVGWAFHWKASHFLLVLRGVLPFSTQDLSVTYCCFNAVCSVELTLVSYVTSTAEHNTIWPELSWKVGSHKDICRYKFPARGNPSDWSLRHYIICQCPSLFSTAVISTITKSNLAIEGVIWLPHPEHSPSWREVREQIEGGN